MCIRDSCERLEVEEMPPVEQVEATVERLKGSEDYRITPFTNQPVVTIQDLSLIHILMHRSRDPSVQRLDA